MFGSCRNLHPEGKSFSVPRSLRTRSGVASVSIGCPVSRALPRGFRSVPALQPFRRFHPALPALSGSLGAGPKTFASLTVRLRRSWSSPPLRTRCASKSASASKPRSWSWTRFSRFSWQASSSSSRHQPSVRGPSWDHRLSRCPDHTLAGDPACGGETIISSGASCRLRFEDPPVRSVRASWGSPIVAKPNSTSSPCRRRSEVPFLSCRLTLAGLLEERAGCPPITQRR